MVVANTPLTRVPGYPFVTDSTPAGASQTLTVNVAHAGDLIIVAGRIESTAYSITGVSDTNNLVSWQPSVLRAFSDANVSPHSYVYLWYGVSTAAGSTTITATFSSAPGTSVELIVDELTGPSASWGADTTGQAAQDTATTSWQTPTLTPTGPGGDPEAYWGYCHPAQENCIGFNGTPSGYIYWLGPINGNFGGNTVVLNQSVPAGIPTQGQGTMYNYPNETTPTPDEYDALGAVFYNGSGGGGGGGGGSPPRVTAQPTMTVDQPVVGTSFGVGKGSWSNSPTSYTYQWQHCPLTGPCTDISGATSSTYTPVAGDQGDNLLVAVTATNTAGSNSAWSVFSLPVDPSGNSDRTFYIDYSSGNDSNNGTSKTTPWKNAPGSSAFTGTYSHQAGDHLIFKGGVTWPSTEFPITDSSGGTSGNPDYYGVDQTWYSGASWTRPIWDAGGESAVGATGCSAAFMNMNAQYEIVDGIELTDTYWGCTTRANLPWINNGAPNQVVDDMYAHDWDRTSTGIWFFVYSGEHENDELLNSECNGSDSTSDIGNCSNAQINRGDDAEYMPNLILPFCQTTSYDEVSHSHMNNLTDSYSASGVHENAIEVNSAACHTDYVYGNVFYNMLGVGVEIFLGNPPGFSGPSTTVWVYDNLSYWSSSPLVDPPIYMDCRNGDATRLYAFGNTVYSNGSEAIGSLGTPCGTATIEDNHFINAGSPGYSWSSGTVTADHNCNQTTSTANGQDYTGTDKYASTSGSGCTVGTGTNLSASIPVEDINGFARTSTWDEGAYQYHTGSPPW
jgi:hypothetical protein